MVVPHRAPRTRHPVRSTVNPGDSSSNERYAASGGNMSRLPKVFLAVSAVTLITMIAPAATSAVTGVAQVATGTVDSIDRRTGSLVIGDRTYYLQTPAGTVGVSMGTLVLVRFVTDEKGKKTIVDLRPATR